MDYYIQIFVFWLVLSLCVALLASSRGRSGVGFFLLAAILSPLLSFVILLCMKDLRKEKENAKKDYLLQAQLASQRQQLEELRKLQTPARDSPALPPPGALDMIHIARNGEQLGTVSVADARRMLDDGTLCLEDYYFDSSCDGWVELAGHPELNPI